MPRSRKKPIIPDYDGLGTCLERAEIQKSRPLQSLSETDLTLPEFKILDAYLSRVNSHDPDKRTVRLEKGELEKALGVTEIKKDDLNKRLRHLFQVIEVKDDSKLKGFKLINLFEEADAEQDDDGLWQITLTCTPSAREYVFNIDNIGYLRYRLKNVVNLTSRYSYVLFLYLLDNRFRKKWSIHLADLKAILNCNAERYKQFKFFNSEILKKCKNELIEKTDISFEYNPVKRGRNVVEIEFIIRTVADKVSETLPEQLTIDDLTKTQMLDYQSGEYETEVDYGGELATLLGESALDNEFSPEQVRVIQDLVMKAVPNDKLRMCNYLLEKIHRMNVYNPAPEKRFSYLCKMLENDLN